MRGYDRLSVYYGDLHNHCGISYGHGSLEDAFLNAREQLDFCSVTHPLGPTAEPDETIGYIIDFHRKVPLARGRTMSSADDSGLSPRRRKFVTYLSFEMHSGAGRRSYDPLQWSRGRDCRSWRPGGSPREATGSRACCDGIPASHIGYKTGTRGINWATFDPRVRTGCRDRLNARVQQADEVPDRFCTRWALRITRSTWRTGCHGGTLRAWLGSTDHHGAHPGSYGHGRTGLG